MTGLLRRRYGQVAGLPGRIDADGWAAASPCAEWTVRQAANHLLGALPLLARFAEDDPIDPAEVHPQRQADTDHLGTDPEAAFIAIAERSLAAFTRGGSPPPARPWNRPAAAGSARRCRSCPRRR